MPHLKYIWRAPPTTHLACPTYNTSGVPQPHLQHICRAPPTTHLVCPTYNTSGVPHLQHTGVPHLQHTGVPHVQHTGVPHLQHTVVTDISGTCRGTVDGSKCRQTLPSRLPRVTVTDAYGPVTPLLLSVQRRYFKPLATLSRPFLRHTHDLLRASRYVHSTYVE